LASGSSIERYRIGDQLGEIVAAAVCAIGRALVGQCSGDTQTEAQQTAAIQLARLSAILRVSRVGSFDTDGRRREAYFTAKDKTYGGAPSRMSFDEAVQHYGKIALRKRLASDTSEAVLRELVSWPLHGLDCTFDHLLRRVTARTARQNSQKWLAEPQAARSR